MRPKTSQRSAPTRRPGCLIVLVAANERCSCTSASTGPARRRNPGVSGTRRIRRRRVVAEVHARRDGPIRVTSSATAKSRRSAARARETRSRARLGQPASAPSQERNLETMLKTRVLDRTALILDIFAQRAATLRRQAAGGARAARASPSRLVRGWTHFERQKGGIGLRGPGETQLETDRRLRRGGGSGSSRSALTSVERQREVGRKERAARASRRPWHSSAIRTPASPRCSTR